MMTNTFVRNDSNVNKSVGTPRMFDTIFTTPSTNFHLLVLLKTPFCVLVAYLLRTLCTEKKKYRNTLYCVVVAYLVFFISGAPFILFFTTVYTPTTTDTSRRLRSEAEKGGKKGYVVCNQVGSSERRVRPPPLFLFFYAHYFVSGRCHVVHSPNRAPQHHHPTGDF